MCLHCCTICYSMPLLCHIPAHAWALSLLQVLQVLFAWLQGFVEAAETFQRESGTCPGVDLHAITNRMEIRKAVQAGDIENAVARVNDLNPEARVLCCHATAPVCAE